MRRSSSLTVSDRVLRVLLVVNWVYGALILALLIASLVAEEQVMGALGARPAAGMRQIAVLGILAVPLAHLVLTQLLRIVRSVRVGDPFVSENAARLRTIAWSVLGLELLHLVVGVAAARASSETAPLDIDWSFSLTPWLAVLLLFVLARVFEQGARMREELAGTI